MRQEGRHRSLLWAVWLAGLRGPLEMTGRACLQSKHLQDSPDPFHSHPWPLPQIRHQDQLVGSIISLNVVALSI